MTTTGTATIKTELKRNKEGLRIKDKRENKRKTRRKQESRSSMTEEQLVKTRSSTASQYTEKKRKRK